MQSITFQHSTSNVGTLPALPHFGEVEIEATYTITAQIDTDEDGNAVAEIETVICQAKVSRLNPAGSPWVDLGSAEVYQDNTPKSLWQDFEVLAVE